MHVQFSLKHKFYLKGIKILNIDCHNNALNVVPKYCSITLQKDNNSFNLKPLKEDLFNRNIEIEHLNEKTIKDILIILKMIIKTNLICVK